MIAALARLLDARTPRERMLLALLGLVALPVAFIGLVALPLIDARAQARAAVEAAQAQRIWYATRQVEIAALPASGAAPVQGPTAQGLGALEAALQAAGLSQVGAQLAQAPEGGVTLSLGPVSFEALMPWLESLAQTTGYSVARLDLRADAPGQVQADVLLEPER